MTLRANALVTIDTVRDELGLASDYAQDARLVRYVNGVSDEIERYCNRKFSAAAAEVETLAPDAFGVRVFVERYPLTTLTSVVDGNGAAMDVALLDVERESGAIVSLTGFARRYGRRHFISRDITPADDVAHIVVTYAGGYVTRHQSETAGSGFTGQPITLPSDIEDAALEAVVSRYLSRARDRNVASEGNLSASISYKAGVEDTRLPLAVTMTLDRYRRHGVN